MTESNISRFSRDEKVQNLPASRSSSELDSHGVLRTHQAEETGWMSSPLDSQGVLRTRQAEQPGSESLMSVTEQVSETPVVSTGRIGGTSGIRRRTQRGPSARLLRDRPQTPWTAQTPATVPRRDGNVVCSRVGLGRAV